MTLQFRFRDTTTTSSGASPAPTSRIKRRFSVTDATAEDLLLFVESLELRPLLRGEYELTLDFPTRVISGHHSDNGSGSADNKRSLQDLEITTDSVVWVTFSAD